MTLRHYAAPSMQRPFTGRCRASDIVAGTIGRASAPERGNTMNRFHRPMLALLAIVAALVIFGRFG